MLLAHLSDPHLQEGAAGAGPVAQLRRVLDRVLSLDPLPAAVLVSGDLTEHGAPAEYALLRELLDPVPVPVHLVAGNHDESGALVDAFAGTRYLGGTASTRYATRVGNAVLLVLDSRVPRNPAGRLGTDQLTWLDAELTASPDVPTLVCVHHPPVAVGIPSLDGMRLLDADALAAVVAAHPQVVRVLCGHLHRAVTAAFAGTVLTVAPSTHRQTGLTLRPDRPIGSTTEPPGFLLHLTTPDGRCVTHTVLLDPVA